jgi:hypothetical protein
MASTIQHYSSSDLYKLIIKEGGEIYLDVGNSGKVTVNGDLDVLGDTTTIGSSELIVADNTITVNDGEAGSGITLNTAGLIVDRGTQNDAWLFFDERLDTIRNASTIQGSFVMQEATGDLSGLYVSSVRPEEGQDLYLLGSNTTGLVTVTGTTDYETQLWDYAGDGASIPEDPGEPDRLSRVIDFDDDALINARGLIDYVASYHLYNFQDRIITGTVSPTSVLVVDQEDDPLATSKVEVTVDGSLVATFFQNRLDVEELRFIDNAITTPNINGNVVLYGNNPTSPTGGDVQIDDHLNFTIQGDLGSPPTEGVTVYSKTLGDGGTGLYFINEDGTTDEFVSRNKALLYSIIF